MQRRASANSRVTWAVLVVGAVTMLATSPPSWEVRAEEQLRVESEGLGDDVTIRVRVELPPTLAEELWSSVSLELTITSGRPAPDALAAFELGEGDAGTTKEEHFSDDVPDAQRVYASFGIVDRHSCQEDAACEGEMRIRLVASDPVPILYDVEVVASMYGDGDNAPPGEIQLTLEEVDDVL